MIIVFDDFSKEKYLEILELFGLEAHVSVRNMSLGMTEKMQTALNLSREAELYMLDEPLAGVDVYARETVLNTIIEKFNPAGTIIISTHLIRDIERIFDTVMILERGRLAEFDTCDSLRAKYGMSIEEILKTRIAGPAE